MHKELWGQLIKLDGQETSQRAKCQYLQNPERYVITMLNTEYAVNLTEKEIFPVKSNSEQSPAGFIEQLCLLSYLINAKELPLANKLVKAESLPGGEFFFRGPHTLPIKNISEAFGSNPSLLYEAGMLYGAKKCDFGNASVEIPVLPRVPVTFVIWSSDNEFDARASILFDQTVIEQLPLDALLAVVNLTADAIISSVGGSIK